MKLWSNLFLIEFSNRNRLAIHQKNQHWSGEPGVKFICEICGVEKKSWNNLYQHKYDVHKKNKKDKRKYSTEIKFNCGICGKGYVSRWGLLHHKRNIHNQSIKPRRKKGDMPILGLKVTCNICGKEYSSEHNLKTHVKFVHEKQFTLSCHVCGLKVSNRSQFQMHLLRNHKEDPVTRQLEEEEGLKLINCGVEGCTSKFVKKEALNKHVEKWHGGMVEGEGYGKLKCKVCAKGFWGKKALQRHERIHEEKRRWKCESCESRFETKRNLTSHRRKVHKIGIGKKKV